MSFSFDDDDEWQDQIPTPEHLPEEQFQLNVPAAADVSPRTGRPPRGSAPARPSPTPDLLRDDDADDLGEFAVGDPGPAPDAAVRTPVAADADDGGPDSGISLRSVFVFLALVVAAYGALAWSLLDDPDWAQRLTQSLPVVGQEMRDRSVSRDVALVGVQGRYERTKEGRLVFVITGRAVNHSADSLQSVQILATLYDNAAQRVGDQVTLCGNPIEARVRDLSIHQVAILRGIRPPPDFGVQPGGQCPFVSLFLDTPATIGSFTTEVVKAQRHA